MTSTVINRHPSSSSAASLPSVVPRVSEPEAAIRKVEGALARGLDGVPLAMLPTDGECRDVARTAEERLGQPLAWEAAVAHAARLTTALPAQKGSAGDVQAAMQELARALSRYPAPIVLECVEALFETCRWRPVPADIHAWCKARELQLRQRVAAAEAIVRKRAELLEERRRETEREEADRAAREAGQETERERMARRASELVDGLKRAMAQRNLAGRGAP